ncbi:hypothetical protein ABPG72_010608 [Tetrahymena utriculariae]
MVYRFIVYPGNNSFVIREALLKRGNWKEVQYDDPNINLSEIDFIWSPNSLSTKEYEKIVELEKKNPNHQIVINHFENNQSLTTKSDMIKALNSHYRKNSDAQKGGYNVFHSIPATYVLIVGVNSNDQRDFQIKFNEISKSNFKRCTLPEKHCSNNIWILKPDNMSQGKGIEIFQSLKAILSFLHYKPAFSKWVIQKYIERPLLYNGRKFDLRVWVLLTNKGELFVYKNGYLRTSSSKYSMQTFNEAVHLTNWSLQKGLPSYEKHEQGNRLPLKEGLQYIFDTQYSKYQVDYEKHIYPRMKDLIIDLVRSCEQEMFKSKKLSNCFELYGFDFIIDEDLRVWLIEANKNPGFGLPTEKARKLIDEMVDELLKLTIDQEYTPKTALQPSQNVFDLIYTIKPSPFNKFLPKNDRRPFKMSVYPIPQLEPQLSSGEKRYQVLNPLQDIKQEKVKTKQTEMDQSLEVLKEDQQKKYIHENQEDKKKDELTQKQQNEKIIESRYTLKEINNDPYIFEKNQESQEIQCFKQQEEESKKIKSRDNLEKTKFSEEIQKGLSLQTLILQNSNNQQIIQKSMSNMLSQTTYHQNLLSFALKSPRKLDPLTNSVKQIKDSSYIYEEEIEKKEESAKSQKINSYMIQSSKIILEPISSSDQQKEQIKKLNQQQENVYQQLDEQKGTSDSAIDYIKTSSKLYDINYSLIQTMQNNSQERKKMQNRQQSRSLFKIKLLNDQKNQQKQDYIIKPILAKSMSTAGNWLKQQQKQNINTNFQKNQTVQKKLPSFSHSLHQSNKINEIKQFSKQQKEVQSPNIFIQKEYINFQKQECNYLNQGI